MERSRLAREGNSPGAKQKAQPRSEHLTRKRKPTSTYEDSVVAWNFPYGFGCARRFHLIIERDRIFKSYDLSRARNGHGVLKVRVAESLGFEFVRRK